MTNDDLRVALRRETYDANEALVDLIIRLQPLRSNRRGLPCSRPGRSCAFRQMIMTMIMIIEISNLARSYR